jgi:hypothetical protein
MHTADLLMNCDYLERFDTTCLTWRHPCFSREQLSELLFECYRKFISFRHALRNVRDEVTFGIRRLSAQCAGSMAMSMFTRYCAWRRTHPMSGGIARILRDSVADYIAWRKQTFGFELAPLPQSLQVPAAEIQPNRVVAAWPRWGKRSMELFDCYASWHCTAIEREISMKGFLKDIEELAVKNSEAIFDGVRTAIQRGDARRQV